MVVPSDYTSLYATGYLGQEIRVRRLNFQGYPNYGQGILHGGHLDLRVIDCGFTGGAHGMAGINAAGSYPVRSSGCTFRTCTHAAFLDPWGTWLLDGFKIINVGRYGVFTQSSIQATGFFIGEGGRTRAVFRGAGMNADGVVFRLDRGVIDFEQFDAGAMVEVKGHPSGRNMLQIHDVEMTRTDPAKPAVVIDTPPVLPYSATGVPQPFEVSISGMVGRYAKGSALVGVNGASTRVRAGGGHYIAPIPLCKNVVDPTQPTWSGFAGGWEPDDPALGGTYPSLPPAPVLDEAFVGLAMLPGLKGWYRAVDQPGAVGELLGATLYDNVAGGGGRAALDLPKGTGTNVMPTKVLGRTGAVAMKFLAGANNLYTAPAGTFDTTYGLTVLCACDDPRYAFRSVYASGLWLDRIARLGSFNGLAPSVDTKKHPAVYALRYDPATWMLQWWINGKLDTFLEIRDPAVRAGFTMNRFVIGGPPDGTNNVIYAVAVCYGGTAPVSDFNITQASYQMQIDHNIRG